jgi:hypothetical protein
MVWHIPSKSYVRITDWDPLNDTYECIKMSYNDEEIEVEMDSVPAFELKKSIKINIMSK